MRRPGAEESGAIRWSLFGMIAAVGMWDIDASGRVAAATRTPPAATALCVCSRSAPAESKIGQIDSAEAGGQILLGLPTPWHARQR